MRVPHGLPALLLTGLTGLTACSCPSDVMGVHDGDQLTTTIEAKYGGPENTELATESHRCTGVSDLASGSTLALRANFMNPADGCQTDGLLLTLEDGGTASSLTQSALGSNHFDVRLDGGCTGLDYVDFTYLGSAPASLYDDNGSVDGGPASFYLNRSFYPTPDSGCAVAEPCSDLFLVKNRRQ